MSGVCCAIPQRYRDAAAALPDGPYVPGARDAAIGFIGPRGAFRCMTCCDAHPIDGSADRFYGHDHRDFARIERGEWGDERSYCDRCGVDTLDLSQRCQAEHGAQQARWSRQVGAVTLVEYGISAEPRCRVY